MHVAHPPLPALLEAVQDALPGPDALGPDEAGQLTRERLSQRLRRDLLPRLRGTQDALIVAIAGPNNVGKSSLFNALVGAALSPARAEGGLTKQCLAAAHPQLLNPSLRGFLESRYELVPVDAGARPPVDVPGPPGRLYLAAVDQMPPGLLVMDTPDFDSVYLTNRVNAEALLLTADLVAFVVSRQTYQNAAVVEFLKGVVGHGRPYLLVYNEASGPQVAQAHLEKLQRDVGQQALARYFAGHQPQVELGTTLLLTQPLDASPPLSTLLSQPSHAAPLKQKALAASLAGTVADLKSLAAALEERGAAPARLRARLAHELKAVGERAALKAVPADVLIEAFRDELDARSRFHRLVRKPFRGLANALTFVGKRLWRGLEGPPPKQADAADAVEQALRDGVRGVVEALSPEVAAWRADERTRSLLADALGPATLAALEQPLKLQDPTLERADRAALYAFCRELVARELPGGPQEEAVQALTTLLYSVPTGAAAVATVVTGGMGHDVVIWAGSLLSTPLLERFVDLLGAGVRQNVTRKWAEAHGASLASALNRQYFAALSDHLDSHLAALRSGAEKLLDLAGRIEQGASREPA